MRNTIDFGIDLGTTNSAIAMLQGAEVTVFRRESFEYTPSAVCLDRQGALVVGRGAWERLDLDPGNAFSEFKPQMGKAVQYSFARTGQSMKPEELAAEVLKSLKASAGEAVADEVTAAVVTVPADFDLDQVAATVRAAALAGIDPCLTYPEPVAAALAHGFKSGGDGVFWLVYDLGGGTFDAALVQLRDGRIDLVTHGGDKDLGGKQIDWAIVERILVPALTRDRRLSDFRRGNELWRTAFAKLKRATEEAKIRLSYARSAQISIDFLCQDDRGEPVEFDYDLSSAEVEQISAPVIRRSINLCKKVLAANRLASSAIEKVLLVGGPTLSPFLREALADPKDGLGIALDYSVDPMTAVARGAAIFAGAQLLRGKPGRAIPGRFTVELEYSPMGRGVAEPWVGGRVVAPAGGEVAGHTLELVNAEARPTWRSGRLELPADGIFLTQVSVRPGENVFQIELCDAGGSRLDVQPDSLKYIDGGLTTDTLPLIHSLGVAMANRQVDRFFEKGTPLPARQRKTHVTAVAVRRGHARELLRIPVVEGENLLRADRNRTVGTLELRAENLKADVPQGSEVEILIEIDASRRVHAAAYVPILDETFEQNLLTLETDLPAVGVLAQEAERQKARLEKLRRQAQSLRDPRAGQQLRQLDEEQLAAELASSLDAAASSPEEAARCQSRLLEMAGALDEIEATLEWPSLRAEAEETLTEVHDVARNLGDVADGRAATTLEHEVRRAIEIEDADLLRLKIDDMQAFAARLLHQDLGFWRGMLNHLKVKMPQMTNPEEAAKLFAQGARAVASSDLAGARAACVGLIGLLPPKERKEVDQGGTLSLELRRALA